MTKQNRNTNPSETYLDEVAARLKVGRGQIEKETLQRAEQLHQACTNPMPTRREPAKYARDAYGYITVVRERSWSD